MRNIKCEEEKKAVARNLPTLGPIMQLVEKFFKLIAQKSVSYAFYKVFLHVKRRLSELKSDPIQRRREHVSNEVVRLLNSTVAYGPFKGLKFPADSWLGRPSRASMLLGLYEQEVLESLTKIPTTHKTFIDLGAADGYYGIGVLINRLFEKTYCFEISEHGQNVIRQTAELNNISSERISINGMAQKDFYKFLPIEQLSKSVLLVDIEGGEFDLFDRELFKVFAGSIIFIELHDFFFEDGAKKLKKLRDDASQLFTIAELTTSSRDPSKFQELRIFSDTDRWLICSEGRGRLMSWYRLDPKTS